MNGPTELMGKLSGSITTVTALMGLLGVGTAETAKAMGVTQRSVQRYLAQEKAAAGLPAAKQQRGGVKGAAKFKGIRKAQANKLRKKSLTAEAPGEIWISKSLVWRQVRGYPEGTEIQKAYVDAMLDAFVDNKPEDAWSAFAAGVLDSYGMPNASYNEANEIDDLYMEWS